ncbi:hypothetical protein B0G81_2236 [Paraburkholderia sp. BL6665CI2N2]|nr:hypothetical protein B0G81_2236 [Paraburkholderia sp. BL6665CI2N2]
MRSSDSNRMHVRNVFSLSGCRPGSTNIFGGFIVGRRHYVQQCAVRVALANVPNFHIISPSSEKHTVSHPRNRLFLAAAKQPSMPLERYAGFLGIILSFSLGHESNRMLAKYISSIDAVFKNGA